MGNDTKTKDGTQTTGLFSITFDEDAGNAPGVTQLLNPKLIAQKEAARKAKEAAQAPSTPSQRVPEAVEQVIEIQFDSKPEPTRVQPPTPRPSVGEMQSLTQMGVHFELQFENERGSYRYARMKPHGKERFEMWQEKFYYQMKLDLRTLEIQGTFQEFAKGKNTFQEDAFALTDSTFAQIVRLEGDAQKIYVLLSNQSLLSKKDAVVQALQNKSSGSAGSSSDDDFKIELAS